MRHNALMILLCFGVALAAFLFSLSNTRHLYDTIRSQPMCFPPFYSAELDSPESHTARLTAGEGGLGTPRCEYAAKNRKTQRHKP